MALLDDWRERAYGQGTDAGTQKKLWEEYFAKEKTVYFARAESSKKDRAAAYQKLRAMKQAQMKAQPKKGKGKSKDHKRDSL